MFITIKFITDSYFNFDTWESKYMERICLTATQYRDY